MAIPGRQEQPEPLGEGSKISDLERIFSEVVEAPRERQEALLAELTTDRVLRKKIRTMLELDSNSDPLLDHSLLPTAVEVGVNERIKGYELLQELARGGMGVVFMAEQLEPVRRKVALKVIKPGVDTSEVLARFDAECHALSMMDHPNIATVLDAGTTESGRPYIAMELVNGQSITDYCERHELTVKKRLELFLPVCHAIQHAHQKGVIHRDIKPSNILVAEYEGRPIPKVIDFGVAKAIGQRLTDRTMHTSFGQIIGTFEYMSPEQTRFNQRDVDTRSDIYSMGVLLYELLTGTPPFDKQLLRTVNWEEMLRIIREEDPPRPSSRLTANHESPVNGNRKNHHEQLKLGRMMRGELDWIVFKAMEKDPNRRYATPNELASDIECFLNGEAVSACPPSLIYRFRKFANRNKAAFATFSFVAAALVLGLIGTTWQAIRAWRAEEAAVAVDAFLVEDLLGLAGAESQMSAGLRPDPNLKLTTMLDRALAELDHRFVNQPEHKANLQATLARSLSSIGRFEDATPLSKACYGYLKQEKGVGHESTIGAMRELSKLYFEQSLLAEAEPLCEQALENSQQFLGREHDLTLLLLSDRAILHQKRKEYDQAEAMFSDCLAVMSQREFEDDDERLLDTASNLAILYEDRGHWEKAKVKHQRVLDVHLKLLPPNHPRVAASIHNLGKCYLKSGRVLQNQQLFGDAVSHLKRSYEIYSAVHQPDHPDILEAQENLAQAYSELRQHEESEPLLSDLVERLKRLRGVDDLTTLQAMNHLGWTYMQMDRLAEAEFVLTEVRDARLRFDPQSPGAVQVMGNLAIVYHRMAKLEQSLEEDQKLLDLPKEVLTAGQPERVAAMARLGLNYLERGRVTEGQQKLQKAYEAGLDLPQVAGIAGILAVSFEQAGDWQNALLWTDRQIEIGRSKLPSDSQQLNELLKECDSRRSKLKARIEAKKS